MPNASRPLPPLSAKDIANFWSKVQKCGPDECWQWVASQSPKGYGRFVYHRRGLVASRIAYFLHYGEDPYPLQVCHSCDNPPCCNPAHLFKGTQKINLGDMVKKGRSNRGERNGSAKLTRAQVDEIRSLYALGNSAALATKFGVHKRHIWAIAHETCWKRH